MTSNFPLMCVSSTKGTIQLRFSIFLQYKLRAFVQVKLDAIFLTLENSILSNSLGSTWKNAALDVLMQHKSKY